MRRRDQHLLWQLQTTPDTQAIREGSPDWMLPVLLAAAATSADTLATGSCWTVGSFGPPERCPPPSSCERGYGTGPGPAWSSASVPSPRSSPLV